MTQAKTPPKSTGKTDAKLAETLLADGELVKTRALDTVPEDVVKTSPWSFEQLSSLETWDEAIGLIQQEYGTLEDISDVLGDGFKLIQDKSKLVGLPLLLMEWTVNKGDFGLFVSVRAIARNPADKTPWKVIFNDGSTGIAEQLARYTQTRHRSGGLIAQNGLRDSEYKFCNDCRRAAVEDCIRSHDVGTAHTYYLDTAL